MITKYSAIEYNGPMKHWNLHKMAYILQPKLSSAFSRVETIIKSWF